MVQDGFKTVKFPRAGMQLPQKVSEVEWNQDEVS